MIIETLKVGEFRVNNYLVINEETKEAVLIDAGGDYEAVKQLLNKYEVKLVCVLNTHGHLDHIAGDYELQAGEGAKVIVHKADQPLVDTLKEHLKHFGMPDYEVPTVNEYVEDGQELDLAGLKFKVIHTPGHTQGGVCYLIDEVLFSGDTLFADSVGRTDLPGGSYEQLGQSIKQKLYTLNDNVRVLPGHGFETTIAYEKKNNPFIKA